MMGTDGVQLEDLSCVMLPAELMDTLREWAAEHHCDTMLPALNLLVTHLGQAGLVVASSLYMAGELEGYRETSAAWRKALKEVPHDQP